MQKSLYTTEKYSVFVNSVLIVLSDKSDEILNAVILFTTLK